MRIGLDATPLTVSTGGVPRYTRSLSVALAETFPDHEFVLLSDQPVPFASPLSNLTVEARRRDGWDRRWWLWGLPTELRRRNLDVFHGTEFHVPYLPVRPAVMTVHDLSPWMNPAWHRGAERVRRRAPFLIGLGLATLVITPTESMRREAMEQFRLSQDQIVAVPHGASPTFRPVEASPTETPYFLFVGTLEPRKNLTLLVDAWRRVRREHRVDLVIAGRTREDFAGVTPEPGLRLLGEVPDEQLPALYSGARAVVYPSLYEGFGLPILEAMQCGAAVITGTAEALREVSGGAAEHLDPKDSPAWFQAMLAALEEPDWVSTRRARGLARARSFSWTATAQRTFAVYREAQKRFAR